MSSWSAFASQVKAVKRLGRDGAPGGQDEAATKAPSSQSKKASASSSALDAQDELATLKQSNAVEGRTSQSVKSASSDAYADITGKRKDKLPAHLRPSPKTLERSRRHDGEHKDDRRSRDVGATSSWASTPSSRLDAARAAALERKAKIYDQLQRGKTGGLDDEQLRDSLVDWDRKEAEARRESVESDSSDDEPLQPADGGAEDADDPLTDYEDDLGRTRTVRRSEVPRAARRAQQREQEEAGNINEEMVTYGPATTFPVYRPDPTARAAASSSGYKRKAPDHFDAAAFEKRHLGAGFYQFSQDEAERSAQMAALREARDETLQARGHRADASPSGEDAEGG